MLSIALKQDVAPTHAPPEKLAFDEVYARHFDYVYRVIARLAGRANAEDLAQEVFVVVHRRLDEFEGRAQITTWLFRIAYRVVGSHLRREKVRRAVLGAFVREPASDGPPPPLRELERAEEAAALERALGRLSWKKRSVLVLHEVEGWTTEVIAERMGLPAGTVHTRLYHARRELREALARERKRMRDARGGEP